MKCKCKVCGFRFELQKKLLVDNQGFILGIFCPKCRSQAVKRHSNAWIVILVIVLIFLALNFVIFPAIFGMRII